MAKTVKPRGGITRPSPKAAVATARPPESTRPPTTLPADDRPTTLNLRVRQSTFHALMEASRERGMTLKQVICHALAGWGVPVAEIDKEDRTPHRKP